MNGSLTDLPAGALVAIGVVLAAQLTLDVVALVVLFRTPRERLQLGARWPWVLVIVLVNLAGAIIFLAIGRRPAPAVDPLAAHPGDPSRAPAPRSGATAAPAGSGAPTASRRGRHPHDPVRDAVDLLYPPAPTAGPTDASSDGDGSDRLS